MKATKQDIKSLDRLLKRSDFLLVNQNAKKWVSKSVIVLMAPNALNAKRYGITVTKKLEKTAVGRNRIKRRLRAVAVDILPSFGKSGADYVLIGRQDTATKDYNDLLRDFKWCVEKLGGNNA